ncbi:MAG: hypothetical protein BWY95_01852 [Bacteroidetes bacterium ADurb.BinA104]|nr:MAG: hypothetical protein BWY95_01852 [Bacteroidetes bacterium ADurb.BinA104]
MLEPFYFSTLYILSVVILKEVITFNCTNIYLPISFGRKYHIIADLHLMDKPVKHTGTICNLAFLGIRVCLNIMSLKSISVCLDLCKITKISPANRD